MSYDNDLIDPFILKVSAGLLEKEKLIGMAGVNRDSFGSHFVSSDSYASTVQTSRSGKVGRSV